MKRWLPAAVAVLLALVALTGQTRRANQRVASSRIVWQAQQQGRAVSAGEIPARALVPTLRALERAATEPQASVIDPHVRAARRFSRQNCDRTLAG